MSDLEDDLERRKRKAKEGIRENLRQIERGSSQGARELRVTVQYTDGTTSVMSINVEVTL